MINRLEECIKKSNNIVFFGGAGVSTESGIPDFRSNDGIYKKYNEDVEYLLSIDCLLNNPSKFYDFYWNNMIYLEAKPNKAHRILNALEKENKLNAIITQNIDGLHQKAGSKKVLELHGNINKNYCMKCGKKFELMSLYNNKEVPICDKCGALIRPDVVLYGESLDENVVLESVKAIQKADLLIVGGTSLVVYPAAGLIDYYDGEELIYINKNAGNIKNRKVIKIEEPIAELFSRLKI